jgi:hypothetical protein
MKDMTSLKMSKEKDYSINSPVLSHHSDVDFNRDIEKASQDNLGTNNQHEIPAELEKLDTTKSIADTFSFSHEIAFIIVTCMAQLTTRECSLSIVDQIHWA